MKKIRNNLCVLALLTTVSLSDAAVTLDSFSGFQTNYFSPVLGGPLDWSHTVGAGSDGALVVAISYEDANEATVVTPGGVTFGSQSLSLLGNVRMATGVAGPGGFDNQVSLWYLANPIAGSANITVGGLTLENQNNNVKGFAGSFFGVGGYTGLTTSSSGTGSLSFSGLAAGSAVFASANNNGAAVAFVTADLTTPLAALTGGGSTSQGGYALGLSGSATASFTSPTSVRTPMIGVALTPVLVPEPSTIALALLGLGGLTLIRKRR